jgi:putative transcriptional regulator
MIVNRLPSVLAEQQISIRKLSRLTGITYTTVRALYHHERRSVQFEVLDAICRTLSVQPGDIFGYATQEDEDPLDSESGPQVSTPLHAEPPKVGRMNTNDSWITWE